MPESIHSSRAGGRCRVVSFLAHSRNAALFRSDPSFIYRCENVGAVLRLQKHWVRLLHLVQFSWQVEPAVDGVVFHRPRRSIRLVALAWWLKVRGCQILAEFDDLVFDPSYSQYSPGVLNKALSLKKTRKNYLAHQKALKLFDLITVSTEPLREHVLALYPEKEVLVLPNAIHYSWRNHFDHLPVPGVDWRNPLITYLPGTRSHDRDFQVFAEGVSDFLNDYPHVRLQVTGPLQFDLPVRPEQIIRREKVPFSEYHEHIRQGWVNLAPLEDTPFTRCKSALKVMEAGYWGRPTICSLIPDAERFIGNGAIPVTSSAELYNELTKLLDPEYYQAYTKHLRQRVLELADINQVAKKFTDVMPQATNQA